MLLEPDAVLGTIAEPKSVQKRDSVMIEQSQALIAASYRLLDETAKLVARSA